MTLSILVTVLVAQQAGISLSPSLSLDVPPEIALTAPSGTEAIQLIVSPSGNLVACRARIVGRGPVEDRVNCKKLMQLAATPAVDGNGQRIFGVREYKLSWSIVRPDQLAAKQSGVQADFYLPLSRRPEGASDDTVSRLTLVTGADGKVEACEIQKSSGYSELDEAACRAVSSAGVSALQDNTGVAVRAVQNATVGFTVQR